MRIYINENVDMVFGKKVTRILIDGGKATGVKLLNGEEYRKVYPDGTGA